MVGQDRFLLLVTPRNHPGARRAMLAAERAHPHTEVHVTRGDPACKIARRRMRGPRLHPPAKWRFYDWRTVRRGHWADVLARRDGSIVVAGISR